MASTSDENGQTLAAGVMGLLGGVVLSLCAWISWPDAVEPLPPPAPKLFWESVMGFHQQADPHQPAGAVVFLGDSITQGLAVQAIAPGSVNYAAGGLATRDLLRYLPKLKAVKTARVVVLTIGTNDLLRGTPGLEERLARIAAGIDAPLIWHAIPPSTRHDPAAVNATIRRLCAERGRCVYVETAFEPRDFRDGVHLNAEGYRRWIGTLRAAVAALSV
jgi:lysophospholipase L1-like esterase